MLRDIIIRCVIMIINGDARDQLMLRNADGRIGNDCDRNFMPESHLVNLFLNGAGVSIYENFK